MLIDGLHVDSVVLRVGPHESHPDDAAHFASALHVVHPGHAWRTRSGSPCPGRGASEQRLLRSVCGGNLDDRAQGKDLAGRQSEHAPEGAAQMRRAREPRCQRGVGQSAPRRDLAHHGRHPSPHPVAAEGQAEFGIEPRPEPRRGQTRELRCVAQAGERIRAALDLEDHPGDARIPRTSDGEPECGEGLVDADPTSRPASSRSAAGRADSRTPRSSSPRSCAATGPARDRRTEPGPPRGRRAAGQAIPESRQRPIRAGCLQPQRGRP